MAFVCLFVCLSVCLSDYDCNFTVREHFTDRPINTIVILALVFLHLCRVILTPNLLL